MGYYYEAHVTVEPVFDERLELFKDVCIQFGFRPAELLMKKRCHDTEQRSSKDSFCTGRGDCFDEVRSNVIDLVNALKLEGFKVWRYKIEDTLLDSRHEDKLGLLHERKEKQEST